MSDEDVLSEAALGDSVALLQGPTRALNGGGTIGPDPQARPVVPPTRLDPTVREKDYSWVAGKAIVVRVALLDGSEEGYALLDGTRSLLSGKTTLRANNAQPFAVQVTFYVDSTNMSRRLPFAPPHVGVAWKFQTDAGDWIVPYTHVDDYAPVYAGAGVPLRPSFDGTVRITSTASGWLYVSGRIEDEAGVVEYDDALRCLFTA